MLLTLSYRSIKSITRSCSDGRLTFQRRCSDGPGFPEADAGHAAAELWILAVPPRLALSQSLSHFKSRKYTICCLPVYYIVPGSAPSVPVENGGREL